MQPENQRLQTLLACFDEARFRTSIVRQYARARKLDLATLAADLDLTDVAEDAAQSRPDPAPTILHRVLATRDGLLGCAADDASKRALQKDLTEIEEIVRLAPADMATRLEMPSERGELRLKVNGRTLDIVYPRHPHSLLVFTEILIDGDYAAASLGDVPRIYDLGANIGIAALYFAAHFPNASLVCVEPLEKNLSFLRENLQRNRINAEVVPAAVGAERKKLEFFEFDAHAVGSAVFSEFVGKKGRTISVDCLPVAEVVTGSGYGLKVDIEGGEFGLLPFPFIFENAAWVTGEIHYAPSIPDAATLEYVGLLRRCFTLDLDEPILAVLDFKAAQGFRGRRRTAS